MGDCNFLADLLDTFQSSSDYIKTVIILTPPAFVLGLLYLVLRYHQPAKTTVPPYPTGNISLLDREQDESTVLQIPRVEQTER